MTAASTGTASFRRKAVRPRDVAALLLGLPLLGLMLLPLIALAARTPARMLGHYLGDSATIQVIGLSLGTSITSTLLAMLLGTPLALLLARANFRGRNVLEVLVELPIVLPPTVAGLALLLAFGRHGLLGPWLRSMDLEVAFTTAAVVIAQTFVSAPFFIKAAAVGLAEVDSELEEAARVDGANPVQVLRHVTFPLAWRGILGGATLCWARALGEFGATIMFAGSLLGRTRTMPLAVYLGFEQDFHQAITLAVILMVGSFTGLFIVRALLARRAEVLR
jgi:molybdate transport system permease protein